MNWYSLSCKTHKSEHKWECSVPYTWYEHLEAQALSYQSNHKCAQSIYQEQ